MASIHPFFEVSRGVGITAGALLFALYSLQMYRDRSKLLRFWQGTKKGPIQTHRVFRVTGWIASFIFTISQVDFYTVFDLYDGGTSVALGVIMTLFWSTALMYATYQVVMATVVFMPTVNRERFSRTLTVIIVFLTAALYITLTLNSTIESRVIYELAFGTSILVLLSVVAGVNYVYFKLRRHHREMMRSGLSVHGKGTAFSKMLRQWKFYTIFLTILFVPFAAALARTLVRFILNPSLRGFSDSLGSNSVGPLGPQPPGATRISLPIIHWLVLAAMLWRSWRSREQLEQSSGTGTGTGTATHNGSGVSHAEPGAPGAGTGAPPTVIKSHSVLRDHDDDIDSAGVGVGEKNDSTTSSVGTYAETNDNKRASTTLSKPREMV